MKTTLVLVATAILLCGLVQLGLAQDSGVPDTMYVEIYPGDEMSGWLHKYLIGATHHDIHHRNSKKNFGLYFTFWDRWMKTEY